VLKGEGAGTGVVEVAREDWDVVDGMRVGMAWLLCCLERGGKGCRQGCRWLIGGEI